VQCTAVCCSVVQCVAVCCCVLQYVAVCCSVLKCVVRASIASCTLFPHSSPRRTCMSQRKEKVRANCSVLQCAAMSCSLLPCCSVLSWLQQYFLLFSRAPTLGAPVYDKEIKEEVYVGCSVVNYAAA